MNLHQTKGEALLCLKSNMFLRAFLAVMYLLEVGRHWQLCGEHIAGLKRQSIAQ